MDIEIIVGFSKPRKMRLPFFSWFIRLGESIEQYVYTGKWELQNFSHCYIQWHVERYDRTLVYQASGSSVHYLGERRARETLNPVETYRIKTTEAARHKMVQRCMEMAGTEYGTLNVVGIAWVKLVGVLCFLLTRKKSKVTNPFADGEVTQPCLETVYYCLEPYIGKPIEDIENWGVRQIRDFVRKIPGVEA